MPNVTQLGGQQQTGQDPWASSTPTSMRAPTPQPPPTSQTPGMPPTGMAQLAASVQQPPASPGGPMAGPARMGPGSTNLSDLANYLGRSYGIQIGGSGLVDEQGTFLQTPKNADEAAKFNLIAQRIADEKTRGYENKAVAALQSETGLLQNRQPGSLARMQAGTYRQFASTYSSTTFTPDNFNYWIAKEQQEKQDALARKLGKYQMFGDIAKGVGSIIGGIL